ncbi:MAG: helix-turn-helix domain-containing protein [Clostridia bacterium]|nr:helix-turn-helix domain-containing protein [Clostridia bacterium]
MSKFSERLFSLRKENNLTQDELCANLKAKYDIETNKSMISKYEKGVHEPGFAFIDYAADYFGVTTDWLMGRSDSKYYSDNTPFKKIPIYECLKAGQPISATENIIGYEYADVSCDLGLKVKGDSMNGARIYDGDLVYIHKQPDVDNGDIAVVFVDGEMATLKRVYKIDGMIRLHSENPMYSDIILSRKNYKEIKVVGKVIAFKGVVK